MKTFFLTVFLLYAFANGVMCVLNPSAVVEKRKKHPLALGWLTGGYFYATERRARITGFLILAVVLFVVVMIFIAGK